MGGDVPNQDNFAFLITDVIGSLPGDGNLDVRVNFDDFVLITNNFTTIDTLVSQGNFNTDNVTNCDDFVVVTNNFNGIALGANTPEPGVFVLLSLVSLSRLPRRTFLHRP